MINRNYQNRYSRGTGYVPRSRADRSKTAYLQNHSLISIIFFSDSFFVLYLPWERERAELTFPNAIPTPRGFQRIKLKFFQLFIRVIYLKRRDTHGLDNQNIFYPHVLLLSIRNITLSRLQTLVTGE